MSKFISLLSLLASLSMVTLSQAATPQQELAVVARASSSATAGYDGQIEAVTETRIAAQVAGVIEQVKVKAGQEVKKGQLLLQVDAKQAQQQQRATQAQADAAAAQLHALTQELERQKKLYAQNYISQGALERIEAEQRATAAQFKALQAQAKAALAQSEFFEIRAPYDGVVIDVPAMQGDMAMPGMPLLTLYNPTALRIGVSVPLMVLAGHKLELEQVSAWLGQRQLEVLSLQRLPTADVGSQSVRLRLALAEQDLLPGQSVKVRIKRSASAEEQRLYIPAAAVVRRAELTAVYVHSQQHNKALLRQVRLGESEGELVEVLSGLSEGEQVYLDSHVAGKE